MTTYYKAVRTDGTSFHDPSFRWLRRDGKPYARPVRHPAEGGLGYLSVSVAEADCTGFTWRCRLLTVEPVDGYEVWTPKPKHLPNKRASLAWQVTGEVEAWRAFGPQGEAVAALIDRAGRLTEEEGKELAAAWAARDAACDAWDAACDARAAAWDAARDAACDAAWGAASALVVRDLISPERFDALYGPWASVIGDPS